MLRPTAGGRRSLCAREVLGKGVFRNSDDHDLPARKDLDDVIVATPDQWHARASIDP
jgi:hypothetical protein